MVTAQLADLGGHLARASLAGAVVCLLAGLIVGPRTMNIFAESKRDIASATVNKYAFEAYPSWRVAHPEAECPWSLDELNEWMNNKDTLDPWGSHYESWCGPDDRGHSELIVRSLGEDGRRGTADDVWSQM